MYDIIMIERFDFHKACLRKRRVCLLQGSFLRWKSDCVSCLIKLTFQSAAVSSPTGECFNLKSNWIKVDEMTIKITQTLNVATVSPPFFCLLWLFCFPVLVKLTVRFDVPHPLSISFNFQVNFLTLSLHFQSLFSNNRILRFFKVCVCVCAHACLCACVSEGAKG